MKKNARILSLLLAVVMMCGMIVIPTSAADAAAKATVTLSLPEDVNMEATLAAGETVTVTVSIANNPGFDGFGWGIKHSDNVILKDIVTGRDVEIEGETEYQDYLKGEISTNVAEKRISNAYSKGFTKANSILFLLVFEAKETIAYNKISVTLENVNTGAAFLNMSNAEVPCDLVSIVALPDAPGQDTEVVAPETCDKVEVYLTSAETPNAAIKERIDAYTEADIVAEQYYDVNYKAHWGSKESDVAVPSQPSQPTSNIAGEGAGSEEITPEEQPSQPSQPSQPTGPNGGNGDEEIVPPTQPAVKPADPEIGEEADDGCELGGLTDADIEKLKRDWIKVTFEVTPPQEPVEGYDYSYVVWYFNENAQGVGYQSLRVADVAAVNADGMQEVTVRIPYALSAALTVTRVKVAEVEDAIEDAEEVFENTEDLNARLEEVIKDTAVNDVDVEIDDEGNIVLTEEDYYDFLNGSSDGIWNLAFSIGSQLNNKLGTLLSKYPGSGVSTGMRHIQSDDKDVIEIIELIFNVTVGNQTKTFTKTIIIRALSNDPIIPRLLPVTVTVGEGAKISTTEKFLIAFGARRTINITVEEGYEVVDIVVNGKSVGAADSYTLKGVAKAQNIVIKTAEIVVEDTITEAAPATETAE